MAAVRPYLIFLFVVLLLVKPYDLVLADEVDGDEDSEDYSEELGQDTYIDDDTDPHYDDEDDEVILENDGDVLALGEVNFNKTIEENEYVLVEFYTDWCDHCKEMSPAYREIASIVKSENVVLAKVEAQSEASLAERFSIKGYPTLLFFKKGVHRVYKGEFNKNDLLSYLRHKIGSPVVTLNSKEEAQEALKNYSIVSFAIFSSLEGSDSKAYFEAADAEDGVVSFQSTRDDVAKVFSPTIKAPSLVLVKKFEEKFVKFDGKFTTQEISKFFQVNQRPLVVTYNQDTADVVFDDLNKIQVLLFAGSKEYEEKISVFQSIAKLHLAQILFVYVNTSQPEEGESVTSFFGVQGTEVMGFINIDEGKKFKFHGEYTTEILNKFVLGILDGTEKQYYKSAPIPEKNDDGVIEVVGNTFDKIVLDESKDVMFEMYAPWCGHCRKLEPIYKKLGLRFSTVDSVVIAKFDGTKNEHPLVKSEGFPTLLFYPANRKSQPITVEVPRQLKSLTQFIKDNAAIPFTLPKKGDLKKKSPEEVAEEKELLTKDEPTPYEASKDHDEL